MVTTMEMWEEFMNKPSDKGVALFEDDYKRTGDMGTLYNLGLALLDIGDWQRAYDVYQKHRAGMDVAGDSDFIDLGLTKWFMGDHKSAIEFWRQSLETEYTIDPVGAINGPLVLWYAGKRLRDDKLIKESLKKLKKFWKVQDYRIFREWPGTIAIAGFLLDKVPADVFLHEWKWGNLEDRRLCRANFWVGMKCLEEGDETTAAAYFKSAFPGPKIAILEYEYFLAKWEFSRLTKQNLWGNSVDL